MLCLRMNLPSFPNCNKSGLRKVAFVVLVNERLRLVCHNCDELLVFYAGRIERGANNATVIDFGRCHIGDWIGGLYTVC